VMESLAPGVEVTRLVAPDYPQSPIRGGATGVGSSDMSPKKWRVLAPKVADHPPLPNHCNKKAPGAPMRRRSLPLCLFRSSLIRNLRNDSCCDIKDGPKEFRNIF
jgi:hypothetical protein